MTVAFPTSKLRGPCKSFSAGCGRWECGGSREGRAEGRNLWSCAGWVPGSDSNWQYIADGSARIPVQEVFWQARPAAGRNGRAFCAWFESACRPPGLRDKKCHLSRSDQSIRPYLSPVVSTEFRLSISWWFLHSIKLYHDMSFSAMNRLPRRSSAARRLVPPGPWTVVSRHELARFTKFWFCIIFSDLNLIYKIPKFHITSAHLTNFQSSQISPSGTQFPIWAVAKYWRLAYALYNWALHGLWQEVLCCD